MVWGVVASRLVRQWWGSSVGGDDDGMVLVVQVEVWVKVWVM